MLADTLEANIDKLAVSVRRVKTERDDLLNAGRDVYKEWSKGIPDDMVTPMRRLAIAIERAERGF